MEKDMELTELYPELVFNLKKVVVVRGKNRVKGRLHRVTACEVAYQCSEPGTGRVFGAVCDISYVRLRKERAIFDNLSFA